MVQAETIKGMRGAYTFETPTGWKSVEPKVKSITEFEYHIPTEDPATPVRVTFSSASGDVKGNIDRWIGQFTLAEGKKPAQERLDTAGREVHFVQLEGTFKDSMGAGPFAGGKTVDRSNYAMLGVIIVDPAGAKYFVKMIGDRGVVEAQKEGFKNMIKQLKAN
jgi:hypothetical protein